MEKAKNISTELLEVTEQYKKENISLAKAFISMDKDLRDLEKVNEITILAQNAVKRIGGEDTNNIMSVSTQKYQIATREQDKTYLIKDKEDNVLLYIKQGKTQINKINDDVLKDFQLMNLKIDSSLQEIKRDLVER